MVDGTTSTNYLDSAEITLISECKDLCDSRAPYCFGYSFTPDAVKKCIIWMERGDM